MKYQVSFHMKTISSLVKVTYFVLWLQNKSYFMFLTINISFRAANGGGLD